MNLGVILCLICTGISLLSYAIYPKVGKGAKKIKQMRIMTFGSSLIGVIGAFFSYQISPFISIVALVLLLFFISSVAPIDLDQYLREEEDQE